MIHKTGFKTKALDVDKKGRVVIAVNAFGNVDLDNDISTKGSFKKTLNENFSRVKWYLNHNQGILLGVPVEGVETDDYLQMTAQLNMNKQLSRDIYEDYRLYAEHGKTLEHSIGVDAIKRDAKDARVVLEWKLWEFSTLTGWGANPNTPLLSIKSEKEAGETVELLEKMLKGKYSDERLKAIENRLSILTKALQGIETVSCPYCGKTFDYNSQNEISLESQVIDSARQYASWIVEDRVHEEMRNLKPEIQAQIESIIASKKSIDDILSYVRCPYCYSKVSRANKVTVEPPEGTQQKEDKTDEQSRKSSTLRSIGFVKK
ncbi:MAG: phage prohead protein [Dysgonamonadaceae bacterium]|jgi:HK97 family phage prohead protease|nr:phage prohead protein [Dysgonamonadaceae bacterium]